MAMTAKIIAANAEIRKNRLGKLNFSPPVFLPGIFVFPSQVRRV
jgi:hypothetical protein